MNSRKAWKREEAFSYNTYTYVFVYNNIFTHSSHRHISWARTLYSMNISVYPSTADKYFRYPNPSALPCRRESTRQWGKSLQEWCAYRHISRLMQFQERCNYCYPDRDKRSYCCTSPAGKANHSQKYIFPIKLKW